MSNRIAYDVQSDCERNLIGWRTESDRMADGIRSDGGRNLIGRRTRSDWMANATKGQKLRLRHEKRGRVKTPNINNKKLVVRSCVDVQRVFVFLQKRAL